MVKRKPSRMARWRPALSSFGPVAHSRRLEDGRAQSLQLDDELAGRQKVAKALREQGYRIAIRMVQQTRNRDYEFWSRDEPQTRNREQC